MTDKDQQRIVGCYSDYCEVIKPLLARIEAESERIPISLFNEIRAFNDHIARCYYNQPSAAYIDEQIVRAERHISRLSLDCFKCLIVVLYQKLEMFERQTRNVDLTVIDNGIFYPDYTRLKIEGAHLVKEAKLIESRDFNKAMLKYEEACNVYSALNDLLDRVSEKVKWARVRFTTKRVITIAAWIASVVISALVSAFFSCELMATFIK